MRRAKQLPDDGLNDMEKGGEEKGQASFDSSSDMNTDDDSEADDPAEAVGMSAPAEWEGLSSREATMSDLAHEAVQASEKAIG